MNDRIKELSKEALDEMYAKGDGDRESDLNIYTQKFAELIINECEQLNRNQSYELSGVIIDTENIGFDDICLNTVKRVEQYLSADSLTKYFGL